MLRQARVGLLVLLAITILVVTIVSLGQEQHFWERKVRYRIHLSRTNGLQVGAQVSLSGVAIGSVTDMALPPDPAESYIEVTFKVAQEVAPRIRENSVASIHTFGLLGDRYVELSPGTPDSPVVPPDGLVTSIDPTDYEAMLGQSGDIVTNVLEVTSSLKDVLESIQRGEGLLGAMVRNKEFGEETLRDLRDSLANVKTTSHELSEILTRANRGQGVIGALLHDSKENRELVDGMRRSVASLDQVTARFAKGHGALPRLVSDDAYAKRVLGNLDRLLAELAEISTKVNSGQGSLGRLVNDPSLYDQAKGLVGGVGHSWVFRLLGGGAPPKNAPPQQAPTQ
jgi:phospholipid/cholesterol/gamma-HCH transport system substrate-binding protein